MDYREKMMKRLDHLNDLWMTSALPGVGPGLDTWKRWTLNYPFDIVCEAIPVLGRWYLAEVERGYKKTLRDCIAYGGGVDEPKGIMFKMKQQRDGRDKVLMHQARLRAKVVDPQEKFLNEELEDTSSYLDGKTEFLDEEEVKIVPLTIDELD